MKLLLTHILILTALANCCPAADSTAKPKAPVPSPGNPLLEKRLAKVDLDSNSLWDVLLLIREQTGCQADGAWDTLTEAGVERDTKINLTASNIPASSMLDVLCRVAGGTSRVVWTVKDDGAVLITTAAEVNQTRFSQTYVVKGLGLGSKEETDLDAATRIIGQFVPEAASNVLSIAGQNVEANAPISCLRDIERLLTLCRRGMTPDDWLKVAGAWIRVRQSKARVEMTGRSISLRAWASLLSQAIDVPIVVDSPSLMAAGLDPGKEIDLAFKDASAEKALTTLLESGGGTVKLAYDVIGKGEVLLLTTSDRADYALACLIPSQAAIAKLGVKKAELIAPAIWKSIAQGTWQADGGHGELDLIARKLLCRQTAVTLTRMAEGLEDVSYAEACRRVASEKKPASPKVENPSPAATVATPASPTSRPAATQAAAEDDLATRLRLAKSYLDAGLKEKAYIILRVIVKNHPDSPEAQTAKKLLPPE